MLRLPAHSSASLQLMRMPEESEFVARCKAGDPGALRALFQRERVRVHRLLFRVVGSNGPLEDLLQDAFLEVFRSLPSFRGESALSTWIERCAVRVAYAHFARKRRSPGLHPVGDLPSESFNSDERMSMREAVRRLYAELDRLESHQRIAFVLFAMEGRTQREIAELTSSSVATVKIRVWRARRALEQAAKKDPLLSEFFDESAGQQKDTTG